MTLANAAAECTAKPCIACPPCCPLQLSTGLRMLVTRGVAICPTLFVALTARSDSTRVGAWRRMHSDCCHDSVTDVAAWLVKRTGLVNWLGLPCSWPCGSKLPNRSKGRPIETGPAHLLLPCSWTCSTSGSTFCRACSCHLRSSRSCSSLPTSESWAAALSTLAPQQVSQPCASAAPSVRRSRLASTAVVRKQWPCLHSNLQGS